LVQTESRYYLVCYPTIEPGTGDLATGDLASFAANGVPLLVRSEAWITTEQAVFAAHAGSSGAGIPVNVETIAQGVTQGIKAL
jgi:hypothetical protein